MQATPDPNLAKTLVSETNPISHRSAVVIDNGSEVFLFITPRSALGSGPLDFDETCLAWLYRHPGAKAELDHQKGLREVSSQETPVIVLLWDHTGQSVAVLINGEPWAFVRPDYKKGFSKG